MSERVAERCESPDTAERIDTTAEVCDPAAESSEPGIEVMSPMSPSKQTAESCEVEHFEADFEEDAGDTASQHSDFEEASTSEDSVASRKSSHSGRS